ncbi:SDR family oxidoreductase [Pokkaliibacter sp. MBI-7]|uniref:SDR family oxidoreductase n=1 Tax=Pokkaliibacter sp. MBI-7 TaxID=3040600 RepID=UPI0024477DA1|nr:SDR family oxidoreductase [Pokkaliibacter sp. MBI-7]MDH2431103.1 SDR family oxidoreductase [Pokkaliibacter sp. MBI-7]
MEVTNKVCVITGGAQGLGRAMAISLAKKGARLALMDVNPERLQESAGLCAKAGSPQACTYVCNITDEAEVEATFAAIRQQQGGVHVLINNAGIMRDGMLVKVKDGQLQAKMSLEQFASVISVNVTGTFLCGREAAAMMAEQGEGGVIINMSSVSRGGNMGQSNYSASKAAVATMVVTWAKELSRHNIRVGGIAPGVIATDMTAQMKPEAIDRLKQATPLGRLGEQEEIANTALYIIENDYFTGRIMEVDGGVRV